MAKAAGDMDAGHAEYPRGKDGDLLAEVQIMVPSKLSGEERELFEQLAAASDFDPRKRR